MDNKEIETGPEAFDTVAQITKAYKQAGLHLEALKRFQKGRKMVYTTRHNSTVWNAMKSCDFFAGENWTTYFTQTLDEGMALYDNRNPTKMFEEEWTITAAESLGKTWQFLAELNWEYEKINKLTWKKLDSISRLFEVSTLLENKTTPEAPQEATTGGGVTGSVVMMENSYRLMKSFKKGRHMVFIFYHTSKEDRKTDWLDFLTEGDILSHFMNILEQGHLKYNFKNPTKFFDQGTTDEEAEKLGRTWQYLLELGMSYSKLNSFSWRKLETIGVLFDVAALINK